MEDGKDIGGSCRYGIQIPDEKLSLGLRDADRRLRDKDGMCTTERGPAIIDRQNR